jgi:transposase
MCMTVVACRIYPDSDGHLVKETATFETMTDGLVQLRGWLTAVNIAVVAMESTGVYWKPVYTILDEGEVEIVVANAAHMKAILGRKSDVKDAEWIAALLRHGLVQSNTDEQALAALAQGRLRDKTEVLARALTGRVRDIHRFLIANALAQVDSYDERLDRLSQEIDRLLRPFNQLLTLLDAIPGVGRTVAACLLAEIGTDMSRFPDQHHLASWAGLGVLP